MIAQLQIFFQQVTDFELELVPPSLVAVRVTVWVRFGAKVCDVLAPLPVPPSL